MDGSKPNPPKKRRGIQTPLCVGVYTAELELIAATMAKFHMNQSAATRLLIHKGAAALDIEL